MNKILFSLLGIMFVYANVSAQTDSTIHNQCHETSHCNHLFSTSPIGITGDHAHSKGSFMLSYRSMSMRMAGNLSTSNLIDNAEVFSNYMIAPQTMQMNMHMFGLMYAPVNRFTIMIMGSYSTNKMDLVTKSNVDFSTQSAGIGDLNIKGLLNVISNDNTSFLLNAGISIPLGNINQRGETPMALDAQLAYPMQLGSGTWDPSIGITYTQELSKFFLGGQVNYKLRMGTNSQNYTLGEQISSSLWGTLRTSESIHVSLRANYIYQNSVKGADSNLSPMMMPLFNSINSGGNTLNLLGGMNLYFKDGFFKLFKIGAEIGYPVYQNAKGIQMKQSIIGLVGIQYVFGK